MKTIKTNFKLVQFVCSGTALIQHGNYLEPVRYCESMFLNGCPTSTLLLFRFFLNTCFFFKSIFFFKLKNCKVKTYNLFGIGTHAGKQMSECTMNFMKCSWGVLQIFKKKYVPYITLLYNQTLCDTTEESIPL